MVVGRSGGHIYPALSVAESLKQISPDSEIHFIHSGGDIGKSLLAKCPYSVCEISIGGLAKGQSLLKKIQTLCQLPFVLIKVFFFIRKEKFAVVFGTGGSLTGPVLLAAVLNGCETFIWEGNAISGLANKYLSFFVPVAFTVFPDVKGIPKKKQRLCGYPLRNFISNYNSQHTNHSMFKILILGGSQGSLLLNQVVLQAIQDREWSQSLFIYHQTGKLFFKDIQNRYKSFSNVKAFSFSEDIYKLYQEVDVIFSRAGSGTICEVAAFKKPLVLVPLSHSAGGHQLHNAIYLHSKSLSEMIKDTHFNVTTFKDMVSYLKSNPHHRQKLATSLFNHFKPNGAQQIAQTLIGQG